MGSQRQRGKEARRERKKEREKSDRYLGYCLIQQYSQREGCVLNMTATGHNKDKRGRLCNTVPLVNRSTSVFQL